MSNDKYPSPLQIVSGPARFIFDREDPVTGYVSEEISKVDRSDEPNVTNVRPLYLNPPALAQVYVTKAMVAAAKSAYWHEVHNGGGYSDKCYEASIRSSLAASGEQI